MISYKPGFHNFIFPDEIQDSFLSLSCIGIEQRTSPDYYYDNADRNIDSYLFQYTLRGQGVFEKDGRRHDLLPGHAFFINIPSASRYYLSQEYTGQPWEFIFVMLKGDHVRRYYEQLTGKSGHILQLREKSRPVQTLFDLYNQARSGQIIHPFHASELGYRFICQLCQNEFHNAANYSRRTRQAIQIMEQHYADLHSIEELSDLLLITNSHFTREFSRETGVSPVRYLTSLRLSEAARLLHESTLPVQDIALRCGFSSGNYFAKVFRQHMHMSPLEYRLEWH